MNFTASRFPEALSDLVSTEPVQRPDLTGHRCRPAGVLLPRNSADVVRIVKAADHYRAKLHPISCGRNWGFGSALPRKPGTWIVNLSQLNDISTYNQDTGCIRIGPGVTQIQLYRELERLGGTWYFNVTGAGHSTSVIGNALERGIGYHGQRQFDLIELEVVTGAGELICTRLGTQMNGVATLGADLTQLFAQTALGIVVSARIQLIPRTDGGGAAIVRLEDEKRTEEFFRTVIGLKRDGAISGIPHIANRTRIVTSIAPWLAPEEAAKLHKRATPWTAALPITGCREMTEASFSLIRRRLEGFCEVETILATKERIDDTKPASPMVQLYQLASGFPSNLALPSVQYTALGTSDPTQRDPEATGAGLIHVTPSVSSSWKEIERALARIESCAQALDLAPLPLTVNVVSQTVTVIVISVCFPADEAVEGQHKAGILVHSLQTAEFTPYRIGIGQEEWVPEAPKEAAAVFRRLASAFDPGNIFPRSKYALGHLRIIPKLPGGIPLVGRKNHFAVAEVA